MTTTPCFIGGTGRSGTTVLRNALALHPAVVAWPSEARVLVDPDGLADFLEGVAACWSPFLYDRKLARLGSLLAATARRGPLVRLLASPAVVDTGTSTPSVSGGRRRQLRSAVLRRLPPYYEVGLGEFCPGYDEAVASLLRHLAALRYDGRWVGQPWTKHTITVAPSVSRADLAGTLGRFYRDLCERLALLHKATHVVDDSPSNSLAWLSIAAMLPDARLVHMQRDPRDTVASMTRVAWAPSDPGEAARFYMMIHARCAEVRAASPPGSVLVVELENLVTDKVGILGSVCDFLGLDRADEVLRIDLSRAHAGHWRSVLTRREQHEVERILGPVIESKA